MTFYRARNMPNLIENKQLNGVVIIRTLPNFLLLRIIRTSIVFRPKREQYILVLKVVL